MPKQNNLSGNSNPKRKSTTRKRAPTARPGAQTRFHRAGSADGSAQSKETLPAQESREQPTQGHSPEQGQGYDQGAAPDQKKSAVGLGGVKPFGSFLRLDGIMPSYWLKAVADGIEDMFKQVGEELMVIWDPQHSPLQQNDAARGMNIKAKLLSLSAARAVIYADLLYPALTAGRHVLIVGSSPLGDIARFGLRSNNHHMHTLTQQLGKESTMGLEPSADIIIVPPVSAALAALQRTGQTVDATVEEALYADRSVFMRPNAYERSAKYLLVTEEHTHTAVKRINEMVTAPVLSTYVQ